MQYGRAKSSFGFFQSTVSLLIEIAAYLSGLYPLVWDNATVWAAAWGFPSSPTASSLLFCLQLMLFETVVSLPFSLFSTFVVEERFGFNKTTVGTFVSDLLKSLVLSCVIGGPVIVVVMHLARRVWLLWPVAFAIQLVRVWWRVPCSTWRPFTSSPLGVVLLSSSCCCGPPSSHPCSTNSIPCLVVRCGPGSKIWPASWSSRCENCL